MRDVVQAVTIARFGPVMPYMIDRWPEIMLMMLAGTKNGEIFRRGPASSIFEWLCFDGAECRRCPSRPRRRSDARSLP